MFLSIVIAIYNEEGNVRELTERIFDSMKRIDVPFELIYIIDGRDRSYEILRSMQSSRPNLRLDHSPELRGFKNAFVQGFKMMNPQATHILTLDGDLNHQPEEFAKLLGTMKEKHSDIVIGSRYIAGGKVEKLALWKRMVSTFANLVIKLLWRIKVHDKTSGFRLYRREVIEHIVPKCRAKNFEFLFEILILASKRKMKIDEVPITFVAREIGESKFNLMKTARGYSKLMFRYL